VLVARDAGVSFDSLITGKIESLSQLELDRFHIKSFMPNYEIELLETIGSHKIDPLLFKLADFLRTMPEDSLGSFEMKIEAIPPSWSDENADRLEAVGYAFMEFGNGSLLAHLKLGDRNPVVMLGDEGDAYTVAQSLQDFFWNWSDGQGIMFFEPEDFGPLEQMKAWLHSSEIENPDAPKIAFDFQAWLDGGTGLEPNPEGVSLERKPTGLLAKLPPKLREVAGLVGRREDDPVLLEWLALRLSKNARLGYFSFFPTLGLMLRAHNDISNEKYPVLNKTKNTFVNYLSLAEISEACGETVLGLAWDSSTEDIERVLGEPTRLRRPNMIDPPSIPVWVRKLDDGADLELIIEFVEAMTIRLEVRSSGSLASNPNPSLGVFVAWAIEYGLVDKNRFANHGELFEAVRRREKLGSDFVREALPRGLWFDHLLDKDGLRYFAQQWFYNFGSWIVTDFKEVFGARVGRYGHDEPVLDLDSWEMVDKAAKVLKQRFGLWL
jgi:hypothetical protein